MGIAKIALKQAMKKTGNGGSSGRASGSSHGEGLPDLAKTVIVITGVALVGLVVYLIATHKKGDAKGDRTEDRELNKEFYDLQNTPQKATLTKGELAAIANNIHTAMDGYGTDEDAILSNFAKLKSDGDLVGLQNAYGIREISSGAFNPEPNFKGTLSAALVSELNAIYIARINMGLSKTGITRKV